MLHLRQLICALNLERMHSASFLLVEPYQKGGTHDRSKCKCATHNLCFNNVIHIIDYKARPLLTVEPVERLDLLVVQFIIHLFIDI